MAHRYTFIDLFCGAGGMSYGFEQAGFSPVLAIDNWQDALDTYKYNNPNGKPVKIDLTDVNVQEVAEKYEVKHVDLIIGGPPCQGFSIAGKHIIDDVRNKLYKSFVSFVEYYSPAAFVMENVPNILSIGNGVVRDSILADFEALGYHVQYRVLTASDYGVPQNRKRAIFVGLKDGDFSFPGPSVKEKTTVAQAISDLPDCTIVDGTTYLLNAESEYQKWARAKSSGIYNQEITIHNEQTKKIISMVPDGGNYKDLPKEYQGTRKVHIAWTRLNSQKPSITIDTGHRHHFHYKFDRVPTVRECARIQSFPDNYLFLKSKTSQYKQVGNAVPPLMAQAIAQEIIKALK